jgi:hypothetical protein
VSDLTRDKAPCPRCAGKYLNPVTLQCIACSAEFTSAGLAHFRALPLSQALRT